MGGVLADSAIRLALATQEVRFEPVIDLATQLQPASVDLRLGRYVARMDPGRRTFHPRRGHVTVPLDLYDESTLEDLWEHLEIPEGGLVVDPGDFFLGHTLERVRIGTALVARIEGKSSYGRLGSQVHSTAGWIDPGFEGQITLEISNNSPMPYRLHAGVVVCQLALMRLEGHVERPYGPARGSKYQGQTGPRPPDATP